MSYSNFTSLPPEQEQQFVVFERQSAESSKTAMTMGIITGVVLFVFLIGLYAASDPPAALHTDALDDDMAAEEEAPKAKKKTPTETAPTPTEAAPAEAPAGTAAAPPPPPGATKAPPSALVGQ